MKWLFFLVLLVLPTIARAQTSPIFAERCVEHYATHYGVPPELIAALIDVESRWDPNAVSGSGGNGGCCRCRSFVSNSAASSTLIGASRFPAPFIAWRFIGVRAPSYPRSAA